ncbi:MAG TPA: PepSY domain-containing protein [Candidatus Nanoarchaeia archaeon]|nr:PepSY domain-containing protein [Candidatus Nanoarchaeia archaeon]
MKRITITIISIVIIILIFIAGFFIGLSKSQPFTIQNTQQNKEIEYISRDEAINIAKDNLISLALNKAYNTGEIIKSPKVLSDLTFVEDTYLSEGEWHVSLYISDNGKKGPYDFVIDAEKGKILEASEV